MNTVVNAKEWNINTMRGKVLWGRIRWKLWGLLKTIC